MTPASAGTGQRLGGGPLRGIANSQEHRPGEREVARALLDMFQSQRALHGRGMPVGDGPDALQLSFAQFKLLFHLPADEPVALNVFAASAGMTPAAATQALATLETSGLVTRTRSETDRRVVELLITDAGQQALDLLRGRFAERWSANVDGIDDADLLAAARVLDAVGRVFSPG